MKYVKYSKFTADPFDGLSGEDLLQMLQDFLLDSGFYGQYYGFYEMDSERTLEQRSAQRRDRTGCSEHRETYGQGRPDTRLSGSRKALMPRACSSF